MLRNLFKNTTTTITTKRHQQLQSSYGQKLWLIKFYRVTKKNYLKKNEKEKEVINKQTTILKG